MTDGFKDREVVMMPMEYTLSAVSADMRDEYLRYGSMTIPDIEPPHIERNDFESRNWDARDGFGDDLLDYLDLIDDEDDEWI